MSELNIVSGPFSVDTEDGVCIIRAPDGGGIAQMKFLKGRGGLKGRNDSDQVVNTARVMAASPNMYYALEDVREYLNRRAGAESYLAIVDEALAIARGEQ